MDQLIEHIRAALESGASPDARTTGAAACRAVLAAIEGERTEPMSAPDDVRPSPLTASPVGTAALLAQLVRVPAEHRLDLALDLAITKLGSMLPADAPPIEVRSPRFVLAPLGTHVPAGRAR